MALIRGQIFFESGNTGWTETYFYEGSSLFDFVQNQLSLLRNKRMALSSPDIRSTYLRASFDNVFRDSQVLTVVRSGTYGNKTSDPTFVSLLLRLSATDLYRRPVFLRGVPDELIDGQTFRPDATWTNNFNDFGRYLVRGFRIRVNDRNANPLLNGTKIDSTGVVTTVQAHGLIRGDFVRFRRVKTSPKTQGSWMVDQVVDANNFKVLNWDTRGAFNKLFLVQKQFIAGYQITDYDWERLVSRRSGRPFGQPAGRRRRAS